MLVFVIEDDERAKEISRIFLKKGYYVSNSLKDMKYADFIYLGLKGIDRQNRIIHDHQNIVINDEEFKHLSQQTCVFTISENIYLRNLSLNNDFRYISLMKDDDFLRINTIMTIEGLLSYIIDKIDKPIYKSSALVLGYGNCGKLTASSLKKLGCDVFVGVRNSQLKEEIENQFHYCSIDKLRYDVDMIINTIPVPIIKKNELKEIHKDTKIFDIASYPYGIDHHEALKQGYDSFIISSIPNVYYPIYSAKCIVDIMIKKGDCNCIN